MVGIWALILLFTLYHNNDYLTIFAGEDKDWYFGVTPGGELFVCKIGEGDVLDLHNMFIGMTIQLKGKNEEPKNEKQRNRTRDF